MIGVREGSVSKPRVSFLRPRGFMEGPGGSNNTNPVPGGPSRPGWGGDVRGPNAYKERLGLGGSGASIEGLKTRGGTGASEAAVARGLQWLGRHQAPDGRLVLDGMFKDNGAANDTAAIAPG